MANKYLHASGGTGNWSDATGTWTTTDQGATATSAPTTSDVAICTVNAGARTLTVDTTTCTAYALTATDFTGTLAITGGQKLTIRQNFTLGAGMTLAGDPTTSLLDLGYSSTAGAWNFAGLSLPWSVTKISTGAITLNSNVVIQGKFAQTGNHNFTGAAYTMEVQGGWGNVVSMYYNSYYFNDAATNPTVKITGGTIYGYFPNSTTGCILEPSVSDIVFAPNVGTGLPLAVRETAYIKAVASTYDFVVTDNTFVTLSFSGKLELGDRCKLNYFSNISNGTCTLLDDIYCKKFHINNVNTGATYNGNYNFYIENGLYYRSECLLNGTVGFVITGDADLFKNANLSGSGIAGNLTIQSNLTINSTGTVTLYNGSFSGDRIIFGGSGTWTYTAGTVAGQTTFNPYINGEYTFDLQDFTFNSLGFLSNFDVLNVLSDIEVNTNNMYFGSSLKIANGKEFTVNTSINACANELYSNYIEAISGTAKLTYLGTIHNIKFAKTDFTNINASSSIVPIYTWYGTVTNCTNVYAVTGANIGGAGGYTFNI